MGEKELYLAISRANWARSEAEGCEACGHKLGQKKLEKKHPQGIMIWKHPQGSGAADVHVSSHPEGNLRVAIERSEKRASQRVVSAISASYQQKKKAPGRV